MKNPQDSRLRAFQRQAAAVLAVERGFSPGCLTKLVKLGEHLRLTDQELAEAIAELQSLSRIDDEPNRYERAFGDFLARELRHLPTGILTLPIENRALEVAEKKYQIAVTRARVLLEQQCQALGVQRVSTSDVERFLEQQISEELAMSTVASEAQLDRFSELGLGWGIPQERVCQIADTIVALNRLIIRRRRRRKRLVRLTSGLVAVAVIAGAVWVGLQGASFWNTAPPTIKPLVENEGNPDAMEGSSRIADERLSSYQRFLELNPPIQFMVEKIRRSVEEERISQYRELAAVAIERSWPESLQISGLLATLLEVDPSGDHVGIWLDENWILEQQEPHAFESPLKLERQAKIIALLAEIAGGSASTREDIQFARDYLSSRYAGFEADGFSPRDRDAILSRWRQEAWQTIRSQAFARPEVVSRLVRTIRKIHADSSARGVPDTHEELALIDILRADISQWKNLAPEILEVIVSGTEFDREVWIEIGERVLVEFDDMRLLSTVAESCLSESEQVLSREETTSQLHALKMTLREERFHNLVAANRRADRAEKEAIAEGRDRLPDEKLPIELGRTIWAANQSWLALAQLQQKIPTAAIPDDFVADWSDLESLFLIPAATMEVGELSETQRLEIRKIITKLEDDSREMSGYRALELGKLASMADGIGVLSWDHARSLARYYLRDLPEFERIAAEKYFYDLRGCDRLIASLADEVEAAELSSEEALSLLQIATGSDVQFRDASLWKDEFAFRLKRRALEHLDQSLAGVRQSEHLAWESLRRFLVVSYQTRIQLWGAARDLEGVPREPSLLVSAIQLDSSLPTLQRAVQIVKWGQSMGGPMAADVLGQSFFLSLLANELTSSDKAVGSVEGFGAESLSEEFQRIERLPLGQRLFWQEQFVLRILRQERQHRFGELMKTGGI